MKGPQREQKEQKQGVETSQKPRKEKESEGNVVKIKLLGSNVSEVYNLDMQRKVQDIKVGVGS